MRLRLLGYILAGGLLLAGCSTHTSQPYRVAEPVSDPILTTSQRVETSAPEHSVTLPSLETLDSIASLEFGLPLPDDTRIPRLEALLSSHAQTMADFVENHPQARLLVKAHTWNLGNSSTNLALTQDRAQRICQYLAETLGLDSGNVMAVGLGDAHPLYPNTTEEGRLANRRVEILLFDPATPRARSGHPSGQAFTLHFRTGQSSLNSEDYQLLLAIGRFLRANPTARAHIAGYTDSVGTQDNNLVLSQVRAESLRDELVRRCGVNADNLAAHGFGEAEPVADNQTEEGRSQNRRVVITLELDTPGPGDVLLAQAEPLPSLDPEADYLIEVSVSQCRLWLYELTPDGEQVLTRTFSVATPREDIPAPLGWGEITAIDHNPSWSPTANMHRRAQARGNTLPDYVAPGSPANPMGSFKMHLSHGHGFRIHGTNTPEAIGTRASSGCIRMHNQEGEEIVGVVTVGTPVYVYY
ncbi:MAG: hypothetical protein D6E12_05285 [Desulfovibrio sp.]|nr:MAG: hypothetical protein D6E12_05285 [Desulfovibrio sp.]